jgi:dGTPase
LDEKITMAFYDRIQLEAQEAQSLAPYAILSGKSRGRVHAEDKPRYRTVFQRDRDRILHSAAFRRLEYKTQVFVNDEGDYYRTRLTHTLEVTQIGRTVARALGANEDLVEAICLAHDLGHPPFGHAGENALNRLMQPCGGFNHNLQSYRVVTELERRYPLWNGLNLTFETLHGIAKHETAIDVSEAAGIDTGLEASLEAQIANAVDELAYNAHDLDDGINAGLLTPAMLSELPIWREMCMRANWNGEVLNEITRHILIRELIGLLVDDLLTTTGQHLDTLRPEQAEDIQQEHERLVCYSDRVIRLNRELKAFLYEHMYGSYRVVRMQNRAERFIEQIFHVFQEDSRQLPPEYQLELSDSKSLERVIGDYIASMTDRSALLEYRRLFDPLMKP